MRALPTPVSIGFDHAQEYGGVDSHRPLVAIEFAGVDAVGRLLGAVTTVVLIDSGADMTMLNLDFAGPLGLDLSAAPEEPVTGIGGDTYARRATVLAHLCGRWVPIPVLFEPGRDVDLLGRAGAFEAMRLAFFHHHHIVLAAVEP